MEKDPKRRNIFKILKQMTKERADVTGGMCVKDEEGAIVSDERGVRERWKRYAERLMNVENEWDGSLECEQVLGPYEEVKAHEVAAALQKMIPYKAAGLSGVVSEMLLASRPRSVEWLTAICNSLLAGEPSSPAWNLSATIPLYKGKGDPLECSSHRTIKLL